MRDETNYPRRAGWACLTALSVWMGAHQAAAQECQADADCGAGYRCTTSTGLSCTGCGPVWPPFTDAGFVDAGLGDAGFTDAGAGTPRPPSAADAAAMPGDAIAPWPWDPDGGACEQTCTEVEYHYCTPAPCTSDDDCPSSMRCYEQTWQECSGGGDCRPGQECEGDAGLSCVEHRESSCAERYSVPCRNAQECGEGFDCNRESTTCNGGGGVTPTADGGFEVTDGGWSCTTETSETGYCNLLKLPCASDTECPGGMTCQTQYEYPPCSVRDAGTLPGDPTLPPEQDAGIWFDCPPPVATQVCRPEAWGGGGGFVGGSTGGGSLGGFVGGGVAGGGGLDDAGTETPPPSSADAGSRDAGSAGPGGSTAGGLAGGGTGGTGSGPGGGDEDEGSDEGHGHGHGLGKLLHKLLKGLGSGGGCSVAAEETAHANLGWLSLLSLALVARGRRRRD